MPYYLKASYKTYKECMNWIREELNPRPDDRIETIPCPDPMGKGRPDAEQVILNGVPTHYCLVMQPYTGDPYWRVEKYHGAGRGEKSPKTLHFEVHGFKSKLVTG